MKLLLDVLNLVLVSFMAVSILGLFFKTLAGLSLFFFPTKIVSVVLKDQKQYTKPVVRTVIPSTSAKQKEDCMTGSPSISKLLHKSATPLLLQTIQFLPVITSNGTILKSSQLESPTCSVKLKKRY